MAKNQELTLGNFEQKLKRTVGAIKKATEVTLQGYVVFAGEHYLAEGDSGLLSMCVNACVGVEALKTTKMVGYIVESSDLKAVSVTIKSGANEGKKQKAFKREVSGSKVARKFELPEYDWTKFDTSLDKKAFEIDASVTSLIKRATKALESERGTKQQHTLKMIVSLKALVGDDTLTSTTKPKKAKAA